MRGGTPPHQPPEVESDTRRWRHRRTHDPAAPPPPTLRLAPEQDLWAAGVTGLELVMPQLFRLNADCPDGAAAFWRACADGRNGGYPWEHVGEFCDSVPLDKAPGGLVAAVRAPPGVCYFAVAALSAHAVPKRLAGWEHGREWSARWPGTSAAPCSDILTNRICSTSSDLRTKAVHARALSASCIRARTITRFHKPFHGMQRPCAQRQHACRYTR